MLMKIQPVSEKIGERQGTQRCTKSLKKRHLKNDLINGAKNSSGTLNVFEKKGS
jgi:hypothetical protein